MYVLKPSTQFKKDYKLCQKRGCNMAKMHAVFEILSSGKMIPAEYHDHPLGGKYKGYRDLHIEPDWVLIYKVEGNSIVLLTATGTHADLFKK
ncbi:MAG: type II toxin-antitoxin system YafQ family toxin [Alphaproteobacteria bacterium]|nr:type II toxin-antitoxin system YafQ family toxin [Alphaproteobacteria bacterium]MBR1649518.1 type II toxin-antitoxin system YafQ family toxin [Alphaproteobacteria bacterium]